MKVALFGCAVVAFAIAAETASAASPGVGEAGEGCTLLDSCVGGTIGCVWNANPFEFPPLTSFAVCMANCYGGTTCGPCFRISGELVPDS